MKDDNTPDCGYAPGEQSRTESYKSFYPKQKGEYAPSSDDLCCDDMKDCEKIANPFSGKIKSNYGDTIHVHEMKQDNVTKVPFTYTSMGCGSAQSEMYNTKGYDQPMGGSPGCGLSGNPHSEMYNAKCSQGDNFNYYSSDSHSQAPKNPFVKMYQQTWHKPFLEEDMGSEALKWLSKYNNLKRMSDDKIERLNNYLDEVVGIFAEEIANLKNKVQKLESK